MIRGIQYLRGIAALLVVVLHARIAVNHYLVNISERAFLYPENTWVTAGRFGVDIFFVISGFVISITLFKVNANNMEQVRTFLRKRLIRIIPFFWVCLCLYTISELYINSKAVFDAYKFFTTAAFQFYMDGRGNPSTSYGVSWTLNFELLFYVIAGMFVVMFGRKWAVPTILFFSITSALFYAYGKDANVVQKFIFNPITIEFMFGIVIAHVYRAGFRLNVSTALILSLCCFAYLASIPYTGLSDWYLGRTIHAGIPSALIVFSFISLVIKNPHVDSLMMKLGESSYSLYLVHAIAISWVSYLLSVLSIKIQSHFGANLYLLLLIVISTVFGLLMHVYVEKPILKYFNSKVDRKYTAKAAPELHEKLN
ncbi:acyltransferase family protein [Enterobacter hormaechei]